MAVGRWVDGTIVPPSDGPMHTVSLKDFVHFCFFYSLQAKMPIDFMMPAKKLSNDESLEVNFVISPKKLFH